MKRLIYILFLVSLVYGQSPFAGGSGTKFDPYLIATPEQFDSVRNYAVYYYFKQIRNIDFTEYPSFNPIYTNYAGINAFFGHYDGDGYAIRNLSIDITNGRPLNIGIFSEIYTRSETGILATVKNLIIDNVTINLDGDISEAIGFLVGEFRGDSLYNITVINSEMTISNAVNSDIRYVGGIIGADANTSGKYIKWLAVENTVMNVDGQCRFGVITAKSVKIEESYGYDCQFNVSRYSTYTAVIQSGFTTAISTARNNYLNKIKINLLFLGSQFSHISGFADDINGTTGVEHNYIRVKFPTSGNRRLWARLYDADNFSNNIVDTLYAGISNSPGITTIVKSDSVDMLSDSIYIAKGFDFVNTWAIDPAINDGYPYLQNNPPFEGLKSIWTEISLDSIDIIGSGNIYNDTLYIAGILNEDTTARVLMHSKGNEYIMSSEGGEYYQLQQDFTTVLKEKFRHPAAIYDPYLKKVILFMSVAYRLYDPKVDSLYVYDNKYHAQFFQHVDFGLPLAFAVSDNDNSYFISDYHNHIYKLNTLEDPIKWEAMSLSAGDGDYSAGAFYSPGYNLPRILVMDKNKSTEIDWEDKPRIISKDGIITEINLGLAGDDIVTSKAYFIRNDTNYILLHSEDKLLDGLYKDDTEYNFSKIETPYDTLSNFRVTAGYYISGNLYVAFSKSALDDSNAVYRYNLKTKIWEDISLTTNKYAITGMLGNNSKIYIWNNDHRFYRWTEGETIADSTYLFPEDAHLYYRNLGNEILYTAEIISPLDSSSILDNKIITVKFVSDAIGNQITVRDTSGIVIKNSVANSFTETVHIPSGNNAYDIIITPLPDDSTSVSDSIRIFAQSRYLKILDVSPYPLEGNYGLIDITISTESRYIDSVYYGYNANGDSLGDNWTYFANAMLANSEEYPAGIYDTTVNTVLLPFTKSGEYVFKALEKRAIRDVEAKLMLDEEWRQKIGDRAIPQVGFQNPTAWSTVKFIGGKYKTISRRTIAAGWFGRTYWYLYEFNPADSSWEQVRKTDSFGELYPITKQMNLYVAPGIHYAVSPAALLNDESKVLGLDKNWSAESMVAGPDINTLTNYVYYENLASSNDTSIVGGDGRTYTIIDSKIYANDIINDSTYIALDLVEEELMSSDPSDDYYSTIRRKTGIFYKMDYYDDAIFLTSTSRRVKLEGLTAIEHFGMSAVSIPLIIPYDIPDLSPLAEDVWSPSVLAESIVKRNFFRGVHPKIWKYGHPQGIDTTGVQ